MFSKMLHQMSTLSDVPVKRLKTFQMPTSVSINYCPLSLRRLWGKMVKRQLC